jgi:hypothetical protein
MHRKFFLSGMATLLLAGSAWAAEPPPVDIIIGTENTTQPFMAPLQGRPGQLGPRPFLIGEPIQAMQNRLPSDYWLGIECYPAMPVLRVHLNLPENEGLVVGTVVPDSPAAKAGIETNDILLAAGEAKLGTVQDLSETVEAAKETPLKLEIIHIGKAKTVEITPAKRPQNMIYKQEGAPADWKQIEEWMQKMHSGANANLPQQLRFRVFQPGAILPPNAPVQPPMPDNMSININRNGDKPADITVKWNDKKWEVTEKELDKLPPEVRPYVERMLGRGKLQIMSSSNGSASGIVGAEAMDFTIPAPPAGTPGIQMQAQPFQPLEERLEELSRKIDQLQKELHKQHEEHQQPATVEKDVPEPQANPADEPAK